MKKILLLAVLAVGVACYFYAPARLAAWVLLGRSPACPMANAIQSDAELQRQISTKDQILGASKLLQEDDKGFSLYDTPNGKYWIPTRSKYVLPFNLAEQARDIYGRDGHGVKSGEIVLDCGANVGVFTRHALRAGAAKIVAIEPAPENIECLRRNFPEEIAAGRVIVYPKGVWNKDDILELHIDPTNSAADSFIIDKQGWDHVERVPLTTIDKLVGELKLERVDYIKMDIEGAEPNALLGARATLAKFKPRMAISAYHAPDHPKRIPEVIHAAYPEYKSACGPCAEANHGVRPDVLYFFP
ncbi:MAG: FkbM family methyltransferase [Bryobacterales bacterium]|nr:FkbM family methyltransferase [Bryobacterales bacterium]